MVSFERHVLGSGPALVDAGKDTFGWTPALAGERAARLKSEVPWGIPTARMQAPPRLEGELEEVLAPGNRDRLRFAVLGLERRMAFCMWGAVGGRSAERAVWRVLTHTILIDEAGFHAIGGNPFALLELPQARDWLRDLVRPGAFDVRHELVPITFGATLEVARAGETLRRREVARLRTRLLMTFTAEALEVRLAGLYAALAESEAVVLTTSEDARNELLIRLAWLSLPPADRMAVTFSTEQGASAGRLPRLAAFDPGEWRGRAPEHALHLTEASRAELATRGQRWWARDVAAGDLARHAWAHARAARRGVRLLVGDDATALARYGALRGALSRHRRWGPAPREIRPEGLLAGLADVQRGKLLSSPGFAGFLVGVVARRLEESPAAVARQVLDPLLRMRDAEAASGPQQLVRGAVRALAHGAGSRQRAGTLRCLAVREGAVPADELLRLLPGSAEHGLAGTLTEFLDGAAIFLLALGRLEGGWDQFSELQAAAVHRLATDPPRFQAVLNELKLSGAAAPWGVSLYQDAEATGHYRAPLEVLLQLVDFQTHPEEVRSFLASRAHLETVLCAGDPACTWRYLQASRPDAGDLAAALQAAIAYGPVDVSEAVRFLAADEASAHRAVAHWTAAVGETGPLLSLLVYPAWDGVAALHRAQAGQALLPAEPAGSRLPHAPVGDLLSLMAELGGSLGGSEVEAVRRALALLAAGHALDRVRPEGWRKLVGRADLETLRRLDGLLEKLGRDAHSVTHEQVVPLAREVLTRGLEKGDTSILLRQLTAAPPGGARGDWSELLQRLPHDALVRADVLQAFAKGFEAASDAGALARQLFGLALDHAGWDRSPARVDSLLALAWTGRGQLGVAVRDRLHHSHERLLPLLVQLLVNPAPFDVMVELEEVILSAATVAPDRYWNSLEPFVEALQEYSPATVAALRPPARTRRRKALLLPEGRAAQLVREELASWSRPPDQLEGKR